MLSKEQLAKITDSCDSAKQSWNSYYYEVFAYTQPERNYIWRVGGEAGNLKQVPLFTQAGKVGANIFVARLQNKLSPFEKPYINFVPKKSLESDYVEQLKDFANAISDRCNEKKNEIRLDEVLNECYYDLVAGTSIIARENTLNGLTFKSLPVTSYKLGCEYHQTVCRQFKLQAYEVGIIFPELLDKNIGTLDVKGKDRYQEVELQDVLWYNERKGRYEYYLTYENDILLFREYDRTPYHILHWTKASDMPYGSGVGLQALPALKRLNSYIKVKLELMPFSFPMFLTQSGNFVDRNVDFKAGGIINVKDINAIQPITMATDKQSFMLEIQTEELEIKQTMLDYTLPTNPTQMTAAEVYARSNPQDEMVTMNISRLTNTIKEIAWDIFDDIFNRELRGVVDFSLEQLHEMLDCEINNDSTIDVNLIQKIQGYIQTVGMFDPNAVWQSIDKAKTLEKLEEAYNLPIDVRNTSDEIDNIMQEQAVAQQEAMNQQAQLQMAIDSNKENAIAGREIAKQRAEQGV